jgi:hypothetical protein
MSCANLFDSVLQTSKPTLRGRWAGSVILDGETGQATVNIPFLPANVLIYVAPFYEDQVPAAVNASAVQNPGTQSAYFALVSEGTQDNRTVRYTIFATD